MKPILRYRNEIPFYHEKTALEFQQDNYERYEEMVVRQSGLHLAKELWETYPFQPIFDFAEQHYPKSEDINIVEVGCGVGGWIAMLAKRYPYATLWGIDYSYQMLKLAHEYWTQAKDISVDWTAKGFTHQLIKGELLKNLNFGLAKAEKLPFEDSSQNLVLNSFLLDRLEDPQQGLEEMYRVLKPSGKLIMISPLNFSKLDHWNKFYPSRKLSNVLEDIGFKILYWEDDIIINEPLDTHGNSVCWKCIGFVLKK